MSCTAPLYAVQSLWDGKPIVLSDGKISRPTILNYRERMIIVSRLEKYGNDFTRYCEEVLCKGQRLNIDYRPLILPCGKCAACRLKYGKHWATRGLMEAFCHEKSCFLTLTLDDKSLKEHGDYVRIDYLQKFFKRLRKHLGLKKVRYLACGEYGSLNMRPHYHCIIFGYYPDDAEFEKVNALGDEIYISKELNSLWQFGNIFIGDVSAESIAYVAGYVVKKQQIIDEYPPDYRHHAPFITMSRKPGLGYEFFSKYTEDFLHDSIRINDKQVNVPRYFIKQFEKFRPDIADKLKEMRKQASQKAKTYNLSVQDYMNLDEFYNLRLSKKVRQL